MNQRCCCARGEIEEFGKVWQRHGYLWVNYTTADGREYTRLIRPKVAWNVISRAIPVLGAGKVMPLTWRTMLESERGGH